jgi:hypothetical protein
MKGNFHTLLICALVLAVGASYLAMAAPPNVGIDGLDLIDEDRPDAPWINKWYALDGPITNTGGHDAGSDVDWLDKGTGGKLTDTTVSTMDGLQLTQTTEVNLPDNGGEFGWGIFTIDPADSHNMNTMYGLPNQDNIDTYAIIIISMGSSADVVMSPAHDDHAQIWINGTKVYGNATWTGGATDVDYDVPVKLDKGANVLLFRCSEGGGDAYFNLHFDQSLKILPEGDNVDQFLSRVPVEPLGKLTTTWGDLKQD